MIYSFVFNDTALPKHLPGLSVFIDLEEDGRVDRWQAANPSSDILPSTLYEHSNEKYMAYALHIYALHYELNLNGR